MELAGVCYGAMLEDCTMGRHLQRQPQTCPVLEGLTGLVPVKGEVSASRSLV